MASKINKKGAKINSLLNNMESLEPKASRETDGFMRAADKNKLDNLPDSEALQAQFDGKQDTIPDLPTIRSGAAAGGTAYQKPGAGIPESDMSDAVKAKLAKAETALQDHQDISGKQDVIDDLATIRSGAAAGGTAYQKPGAGIPESDMSDAVKAKLAKAETALQEHQDISGKQDVIQDLATIRSGAAAGGTAYQKPVTGIPASDLSSEVQDMIENGGKTKSVSVNGGTPVTPDANGLVDLTIEQANVTVGTVTTGAAGSDAEVHNSGTGTAPVLDFVIPKGDDGGVGPQGPQGDSAVYNPDDPDTPDFVMANTKGQSTTKAMTQKAVTDELDKLTDERIDATYTKGRIIQPSGYSNNSKNAVSNELSFANEIGKVKIMCPTNKTRAWVYSIDGATIANITKIDGVVVEITDSNPFYFTPVSGIRYVVRVSTPGETAAAMTALTDDDWPIVTQFYSDPKHFINENANAIAELQDITVVPQTIDFAKYVASTWYISAAGLWAVGASLSANSSYVIPISGGEKYIVESSTNYDCNVEFLATYDPATGATPGFAESRIGAFRGTRTLIAPSNARFLYVRNANTNVAAYLPKSVVEMVPVNKAIPSNVSFYAFERNYSNVTGLLTFETKEISAQGISDSNDKMLAKLPNRGYIEVRLNRAVGGFSVWKKNGNTITQLQGYCFSQYRYIGDYSSDYYVMVQLEQNDPPLQSVVSVYTYGDFGVRTTYDAPSWIKGKKVAFVGDSIVQGAQGKNIIMDKPWPVFVAEAVGSLDFVNFGIGGAHVYGNEWKSVYNNAANVQDFDVVFVCAGTNDYGGKTSEANFESAYTSVIETLMANNTKVIAMTPVNRTKAVSSPAMSFAGYCDSVIDVASSLGVDVIYMHQFTNNESFNSHLVDGLHPDEIGQRMIADILLEQIKNLE